MNDVIRKSAPSDVLDKDLYMDTCVFFFTKNLDELGYQDSLTLEQTSMIKSDFLINLIKSDFLINLINIY